MTRWERLGGVVLGYRTGVSNEPDARPDADSAEPSRDQPVVESPGDSDAPDSPDAQTVYPDEQGVPGDAAEG